MPVVNSKRIAQDKEGKHRGSYMSAHVLLNLSNELRKGDNILSLFPNKFNKFNNTGAQLLDSIYHMALKLLFKSCFCVKNAQIFFRIYATLLWKSLHYY